MSKEHWILFALIGVFFAGMLLFSLLTSNQSRTYRWTLRIAVSAILLWIGASLGGISLNGLNLSVFSCLGLPGYAALTLLSKL